MMGELAGLLLPLVVLVPLGAGLLALVLGRFSTRVSRLLGESGALLSMLVVLALAMLGAGGTMWAGGWNPLNELGSDGGKLVFSEIGGIALCADPLALLVLCTVGVIGALVAVYCAGYMEGRSSQSHFYGLFLIMLAGLNGCALSADLFNFFAFMEVASIAGYGLIAFGTEGEDLEAAFKSLVMGSLAALLLLLGIALVWGSLGALNFGQVALKLRAINGGLGGSPILLLASAFILVALGLKAAAFPFHGWLPDAAGRAPAPVAAMLSGVMVKVVGVYAVARLLFQVFEAYRAPALVWAVVAIGALSMLAGALMSAGQWDFRRLLAYHGISQTGLVFLGLGLALACTASLKSIEERAGRLANRATAIRLELTVPRGRLSAVRAAKSDLKNKAAVGELTPAIRADLEAEMRRFAPEGEAMLERKVRWQQDRLDSLPPRLRRLNAAATARSLALALLLLGAVFHMVNSAVFRCLLVLCAGAVERGTGTRNLRELGGLWQRMPVTSATCALGALSASAVPPFAGFWSTLLIAAGAGLAGYYWLLVLIVVTCFLGICTFARVQKYALFGPMSARVLRGSREAPASMCFSMIVLAGGCVLLGVLALWVIPGMITPAVESLQAGASGWETILKPLGIG
jgi:formate hydrogenlyase subunit 3/multisubunit Na+/H+ antiporter MnhD subunit